MDMKNIRILSIDDEENFTDMIKQYFDLRGYKIDIAHDGVIGLELFRKYNHAVVLLDLKMIGLNGDEVMREIKKIKPDTKIIFITAFSDSGKTKNRLMEEGAYGYFEKPLQSLKILEESIKNAVS
ncbi:Signal transduction response regulator, receiver region domain protein [Candidatus Omnitrophus magneticus]|uniref:Signal transduction response regulator, receiver region domain protein n=1 Tax=Candidatus Omnitrophus magneticus TaxID=1609969 RepID=A0A0F0CNM2_9BACT|nr:Signal transduction response regulator, receiver region domain protein [Candidatus Omnitrophus magneticus]